MISDKPLNPAISSEPREYAQIINAGNTTVQQPPPQWISHVAVTYLVKWLGFCRLLSMQ